jgi:hypothetical protein
MGLNLEKVRAACDRPAGSYTEKIRKIAGLSRQNPELGAQMSANFSTDPDEGGDIITPRFGAASDR